MIPGDWSSVLNHLWQSTIFAVVVALLALVLRKSEPRTRYWLWLAASIKFLVPFSLLVSIGSHVEWRTSHTIPAPGWPVVMQQISRPLLAPVAVTPGRMVGPLPAAATPIPSLLFFAWAAGTLFVLVSYLLRWRRIYLAKRQASSLDLTLPITALSSPALLEPAVFGVVRPVLLLPEGITDRLTPPQLEAIFAHELCHVRYRDNVAAALHIVVEAIFWFHPLVWWIGARLVDERERACDEAVLRAGNEPQVYAEAILEVCKFYLESPLVCAAGVSGANLKRRVEIIMTARIGRKLRRGGRLLLTTAGTLSLAIPILVGLVNAPARQVESPGTDQAPQSFKSASIKVSTGVGKPNVTLSPREFVIRETTLRYLIRMAYQIRDSQISGGPAWMNSRRYDITAKLDGRPASENWAPWSNTRWLALQVLLKERFHLKLHREMKELPIYTLTVAKNGLKLHPFNGTCSEFVWSMAPQAPGTRSPNYCGIVEMGPNTQLNHTLDVIGMSIAKGPGVAPGLTTFLSNELDRNVIDKTGLKGLFDFHLEWNREATARALSDHGKPEPPADPDSPSIFTAVQEQLGLKLDSATGPVEILVVDHAEKPSGD